MGVKHAFRCSSENSMEMVINRLCESGKKDFYENIHRKKQCFGSGFIESGSGSSILGWIPIRIQGFDDQKLEKLQLKKNLTFFGSKIAVYLSLGIHKGRPSSRWSFFQPSKENIQHLKMNFLNIFYFCRSLLPLNPDPDPLTWFNPDPTRIRNRNTEKYWAKNQMWHCSITHLFPCAWQCCLWRAPWEQTRPQTKATSGC